MFEYLKGKIVEINPAFIVLELQNTGYFINISLHTYSQLQEQNGETTIFIHQVLREDANILFGFAEQEEREIFRLLISVSGVGANTARMMLSSLNPEEIKQAIVHENVNVLKSIKGIGAKSAQRVIIDLRDKIGKAGTDKEILPVKDNTIKNEAFSALVMLGFTKSASEKAIEKITAKEANLTVEEVIKKSLKIL